MATVRKASQAPGSKISIAGHAGTGHWQVEGSSNSGASSLRWYRDVFCQNEVGFSKLSGKDIYSIIMIWRPSRR